MICWNIILNVLFAVGVSSLFAIMQNIVPLNVAMNHLEKFALLKENFVQLAAKSWQMADRHGVWNVYFWIIRTHIQVFLTRDFAIAVMTE